MRTLYLLRHAKSSWTDPTLPDRERALAKRGRRDAKLIAKHLRRLGGEPDLVLCSSATRTRQTLELMLPGIGSATVLVEDELYAASSDELLARLRLVPNAVGSVMLIGHNPGIHELALALAGSGDELEGLRAKFPTAALATLMHRKTWSRLGPADATLAAYVVPKELR
jgi:phosphohistidine phosphatase